GNGEVGGCAAEHVGENDDAGAVIGLVDGRKDIVAAVFHIVIGTDGNGLTELLRAYYMFKSRLELVGKRAMRHQNQTNHALSPGCRHATVNDARGIPVLSCPLPAPWRKPPRHRREPG